MTARVIRKSFAMLVAVPLFVFLAWLFGIYFQPQGGTGAGMAAVLILISAIASIWVYAWLVKPGPKARFRNRGVDGYDHGHDYGVGLLGASQSQRRRDDTDGDPAGPRRSGDRDADDADEGSLT